MTDNLNPEELARLYLELWQKPLAGLTRDPQVAEGIARMFDLMTAGAATFAKIVSGQAPGVETPGSRAMGAAARAKDSPNAADVSPKNDARLDQIARRLAELERRVAGLEPRARVRRTRAQARTRRPRRPG